MITQEQLNTAKMALLDASNAKHKSITDTLEIVRHRIERWESAIHDPGIRALRQQVADLTAQSDAEAIAAARAQCNEGQSMVEWNSYRVHYIGDPQKDYRWRVTGLMGVREIWTEKSIRPANLASYSIPVKGQVVIRLKKKDGSPSAKFVTRTRGWFPEGTDPNAGEQK